MGQSTFFIAVNNLVESDLLDINNLLKQLSPSAQPTTFDMLTKVMEHGWLITAVSVPSAQIIGMTTLTKIIKPTAIFGTVEDVVVDENHRGKKIGDELIEELIRLAQANGLSYLDLSSNPHRKAANHLYQKKGFLRRDSNFYRLGLRGTRQQRSSA